jgi:hypothetical protein
VEIDRKYRRRHLFVLAVAVADSDTFHNRVPREEVLEIARSVWPDFSDQKLLELLVTYTKWPFGDAEGWRADLAKQKQEAQTVYPLKQ